MMTVKDLIGVDKLTEVILANEEKVITEVFCCDLLSVAMGKAPEGCAWVTVMANKNTLAVASLVDCSCVIIAEGIDLLDEFLDTANEQGINVYKTSLPIYKAAKLIDALI